MDNNEKRMLIVDNTIEMLTATRKEMLEKGASKERIYAVEQEIQSAKEEFDRLFEAWASGRDEIGRIQEFMNLMDMAAEDAAMCNTAVDDTAREGIDRYRELAGSTDWSMCNEFIVPRRFNEGKVHYIGTPGSGYIPYAEALRRTMKYYGNYRTSGEGRAGSAREARTIANTQKKRPVRIVRKDRRITAPNI